MKIHDRIFGMKTTTMMMMMMMIRMVTSYEFSHDTEIIHVHVLLISIWINDNNEKCQYCKQLVP